MDWLKEYKNRDNKTFSQIFSMIEENLDNNFIIKEQKDWITQLIYHIGGVILLLV